MVGNRKGDQFTYIITPPPPQLLYYYYQLLYHYYYYYYYTCNITCSYCCLSLQQRRCLGRSFVRRQIRVCAWRLRNMSKISDFSSSRDIDSYHEEIQQLLQLTCEDIEGNEQRRICTSLSGDSYLSVALPVRNLTTRRIKIGIFSRKTRTYQRGYSAVGEM